MSEPQYIFPSPGEIIQEGDECWSEAVGWREPKLSIGCTVPKVMLFRRRIDPQGWREIAKEKPVAPCLVMSQNGIVYGTCWSNAEIALSLEAERYNLWLPISPLPKPDEADEAWEAWWNLGVSRSKDMGEAFKAGWKAAKGQ